MKIGDYIKHLREAKGLNLKQLSALCGVNADYISKIEKGTAKPTVEKIEWICTSLSIEVHFIPTLWVKHRTTTKTSGGRKNIFLHVEMSLNLV